MTGVQALVRFLKENPGTHDADGLAERFKVGRNLVLTAMGQVHRDVGASTTPKTAGFGGSVVALWMKATSKPLVWLLTCNGLGLAAMLAGESLSAEVLARVGLTPLFNGILFIAAMFLGPVVQIVGVMRHGSMKSVFQGVGLYAASISILALMPGDKGKLGLLLAAFVMCVMYVVFAAPAVLACAYFKVQKERKAVEKMTRQQLLERLFAVRKALEDPQEPAVKGSFFETPFVLWAERYRFVLAFVVSFAVSCGSSVALLSMDPGRKLIIVGRAPQQDVQAYALPLIVSFVLVMVGNVGQFAFGALCRKPLATIGLAAIHIVANGLVMFLPFAYITSSDFLALPVQRYILGYVMIVLLSFAGFAFRSVAEHRVRARLRRANDPDALMAELLELEWRLTPRSSRVTVLAVDVAGSTRMKQGKDPLVAEWSFRAYQDWIESTCAPHGGVVHSTAGDGAILGFPEPVAAMNAAKSLLAGLPTFNSEVNRLDEPFALRIGIHQGDVQGDLGDVQFTRVIDVAAHLESLAPVGGFAVSETVIGELPAAEFTLSAATTDGHQVYAWTGA
ncbi:MAG: adenylate/guanylate cyclase domain-containing protein [Armatimonadetes bacterium]|nr:adenylate/guanylate cyclase domain-containing protein [Armatimonadota bacterium]